MRHNFVAPDALAEILEVTNNTRLWDAKLTWYSRCASLICWICLHGLVHGLRTHGFRITSFGQIIEVLAIWAKFLIPSDCCTTINCAFIFRTTNASDDIRGGVMTLFEHIKHQFANETALHVHLSGFRIAHVVKQCTRYKRTNLHDNTYYRLNCFSNMIYSPKSRSYQNILKLFTHPSTLCQLKNLCSW